MSELAFGLVFGFFGILLLIFMVPYFVSRLVFNHYHKKARSIEKNKCPYQDDIPLKIIKENRIKIGYPADFKTFFGYCLLVKEQENKLHFNYPNSPKLELLSVEYLPQYNYRNTNTGNGNFGGVIRQETMGDGILTFKNLSNDTNFVVGVRLGRKDYIKLKSEFLTVN